MFSAGLKFALGLGVGCLTIYGVGLGCTFAWFEVEILLKRRRQAAELRARSAGPGVRSADLAPGGGTARVLPLKRT